MDDLTNIFGIPSDSEPAASEDLGLEVAGQILVKLAAEEGVDLSTMPDADLAGLVDKLRGVAPTSNNSLPPEQEKEASHMNEHEFDAFVTQEVMKIAEANEVQLASLSPAEFAELKTALAEEIQADPEAYFAKLAQAEEAQQKIAEAELSGRIMARSFLSELAENGVTFGPADAGEEKVASTMGDAVDAARRGAGSAASKAGGHFNSLSQRLGRAVEKHTGIGEKGTKAILDAGNDFKRMNKGKMPDVSDKAQGEVRDALKSHYQNLGKKTMAAGAAGAAGVTAGAAAAHKRNKEASAEVVEITRQILIANGIDPDTGVKVAADRELSDETAAQVAELLSELGYLND